ncbi:myb-like protein V isoform X2 [Bombus huntii]|uniref:myb-like protein V isoform X2 n=1 Tax=Bombus huntii TaxID=85661 RepID=UPI0021AA46B0|nr:myb-like protein V isoform X2 [Bombus huntii]
MAEKVTKNQKLHEQSMKTAVQSQLAKIKKEEEEELWISGEELYTEGSSDEEEYEAQLRSRRKINSNQSSRASSANPSVERRGHSPVPSEIKSKSDHSMGARMDITENQFMLKFVSQYDKTSSKDSSRTPPIESPRSDRLPTTETSMSSVTKDFSELSTTEDQIENMEISWKANKELLHNNEELFRSEWDDDINISNIAAQDECIRKEILEVENLDNVIHVMNDKVKVNCLYCKIKHRSFF